MTSSRRIIPALAALALTACAWALPACAAQTADYTDAAFAAAEKTGQPILIDTFATWCDICNRQKPILGRLMDEPKYKDYVVLRVNFDTQRDVMRWPARSARRRRSGSTTCSPRAPRSAPAPEAGHEPDA